jgi:hypothetical protein
MEMKSPQTIWASVVIVFILVASATTLVILDKDVSIILTLTALVALPVLGGLGIAIYHKLDQVKEDSNSIASRACDMQKTTQDQLTAMALAIPTSVPPAPSPPPPVEEAP